MPDLDDLDDDSSMKGDEGQPAPMINAGDRTVRTLAQCNARRGDWSGPEEEDEEVLDRPVDNEEEYGQVEKENEQINNEFVERFVAEEEEVEQIEQQDNLIREQLLREGPYESSLSSG